MPPARTSDTVSEVAHVRTLGASFKRSLLAENKSPSTIEVYTSAVTRLAEDWLAGDPGRCSIDTARVLPTRGPERRTGGSVRETGSNLGNKRVDSPRLRPG